MSFTEKEIKSKFKALMSLFPDEGIKAEDLLIFFRSSPGLAKICDPETGNAAMANAFADLTESLHHEEERRNLPHGAGTLLPEAQR